MLFETYRASVDAFVAANRENVIRDIKRLVDVPSVEGPAEPGPPPPWRKAWPSPGRWALPPTTAKTTSAGPS